jgi:hypothetical protein
VQIQQSQAPIRLEREFVSSDGGSRIRVRAAVSFTGIDAVCLSVSDDSGIGAGNSVRTSAVDRVRFVPLTPADLGRPVLVRPTASFGVNSVGSSSRSGDLLTAQFLVYSGTFRGSPSARLVAEMPQSRPGCRSIRVDADPVVLNLGDNAWIESTISIDSKALAEYSGPSTSTETAARISFTGFEVTDMLGQRLTDFTIESASGTDYNRASLPGDSPSNPELPAGSACGSRRAPGFSFPRARSGRWSDPPAAWAFDYRMDSGEVFTAIAELPMGLDRGAGYRVLVGEQDLGLFPGGARVDFSSFPGGGVRSFRIADIAPAEPNNPTAFPVRLDFNAEYAAFSMFPVVCLADHDGSGFIDADDFVGYLTDFSLGCVDVGQDAFGPNPSCSASADADESEFVDSDDFVEYVRLFNLGC